MDLKKTFTVLIAEDDRALGFLVERTLNRAGFPTHRVYNGRQTLDFCKEQSPEQIFLLLDYELGDMTAEDIVLQLEKQEQKFPFIVMTGHGSEKTAVKMMKLGSEDYLIKNNDLLELLVPVLSQALERKYTKQALEKAQRMLYTTHQAIMAADNGVVIAEIFYPNCPIIYCNPAFEKITGYQCSSHPTLMEWLDSYDQQKPGLQEIRTAIQNRESSQIQLDCGDHSSHRHEVNLSFIQEIPEQESMCIGVLTDTTQKYLSDQKISLLRQQLEQTQRLAITGQISQELAHEIGQPLTHISSKIQFMASKNVTDSEDFFAILKHIDRITNLLRSFSSNETERFSPTMVSIHSVMKAILELCPCDNGILISADIPEDLPKFRVDKAKIIQVLLNLLTNAMEACKPKGTIYFSSKIRALPETEEQYITISVRDNGCGIEPENLQKIFDPFFSTKSQSRDRGLGLPICQNIVHLHRGWIEVESRPGQGACFTLMLPLQEPVTIGNTTASVTDRDHYL